MTNTAEMIVRVRQIGSQIEEASAKGFKENPRALNLVSELKDAVELLEELAFREFGLHAAREQDARLIQESNGGAG